MVNPTIGGDAKALGLGIKKGKKRSSKNGEGKIGDILCMVNPTVGGVAKTLGLGCKKNKGIGIPY
jgi:hypothetical protein